MQNEQRNKFLARTLELFTTEFGEPSRKTVKVSAWNLRPDVGIVVQVDQPTREQGALVWLPYPEDGQTIPEIALEYPGEAGRHSNTYPSPGLKRGLPALRLFIRSESELADTINYIKAYRDSRPLPEVKAQEPVASIAIPIDPSQLPEPKVQLQRREAIPRVVQREVWQRDGGKCVECGTREKLCFDHIVPFSRGGSNTIRNIQLLCEGCNLSKGNRI
jgi:HNH endonuclease